MDDENAQQKKGEKEKESPSRLEKKRVYALIFVGGFSQPGGKTPAVRVGKTEGKTKPRKRLKPKSQDQVDGKRFLDPGNKKTRQPFIGRIG